MPGSENGNRAETAFRDLIRVYGLIGRIMQPYFSRMGISGSQYGVLRILHRAEQEGETGLRILELGSRLLVRPPSVSGLVNRLRRMGYIDVVMPKTDLRCKEVHLTAEGRLLVEQVLRTHVPQIELLMGALNESELQTLSGFMRRLGDYLDGVAVAPPSAASRTASTEEICGLDIVGPPDGR